MWFYWILKFSLSALLIVVVSEVAKRSGGMGGLLASLPLVSLLSFLWVYRESGDTKAIAALSQSIAWFILPSFVLFLTLPLLLKRGMPFYGALTTACVLTMLAYGGMMAVLAKAGIKL